MRVGVGPWVMRELPVQNAVTVNKLEAFLNIANQILAMTSDPLGIK